MKQKLVDSVSSQMMQLTARYCENLKDKLNLFELSFEQGENNCWLQEDVITVKQLAHKLAGSAAMFGFIDISNKAKALDDSLSDYLENSLYIHSSVGFARDFEDLRQELKRTIATCYVCGA